MPFAFSHRRSRCLGALAALATALASAGAAVAFPSTQIIGGKPVAQGELPFLVSLQKNGEHFCTGTLISAGYVLTAAHCVSNPAAYDDIRIVINRADLTDTSHGVEVPIGKVVWDDDKGPEFLVYVHPQWSFRTGENDVAVLGIAQSEVKEFPQLVSGGSDNVERPGRASVAAGWGLTETGLPDRLMQTTLPILSKLECMLAYPENAEGRLWFRSRSMLCAGTGGRSTCNGDSGGPQLVPVPGSRRAILVGVTSWGGRCGWARYPSVFARLSAPGISAFLDRFVDH